MEQPKNKQNEIFPWLMWIMTMSVSFHKVSFRFSVIFQSGNSCLTITRILINKFCQSHYLFLITWVPAVGLVLCSWQFRWIVRNVQTALNQSQARQAAAGSSAYQLSVWMSRLVNHSSGDSLSWWPARYIECTGLGRHCYHSYQGTSRWNRAETAWVSPQLGSWCYTMRQQSQRMVDYVQLREEVVSNVPHNFDVSGIKTKILENVRFATKRRVERIKTVRELVKELGKFSKGKTIDIEKNIFSSPNTCVTYEITHSVLAKNIFIFLRKLLSRKPATDFSRKTRYQRFLFDCTIATETESWIHQVSCKEVIVIIYACKETNFKAILEFDNGIRMEK